ncbi:hypothetical protein TNCV_337101, partial [Trichonephila clavipes]
MSIFSVHPSTPPPTMEPNKGEAARRSSDMRMGTALTSEVVLSIVLQNPYWKTAEQITSRLTGAGSLLPPVYGEAWAKGHATGTPDSTFPGTGRRTRQTCGSDSKTSLNITKSKITPGTSGTWPPVLQPESEAPEVEKKLEREIGTMARKGPERQRRITRVSGLSEARVFTKDSEAPREKEKITRAP